MRNYGLSVAHEWGYQPNNDARRGTIRAAIITGFTLLLLLAGWLTKRHSARTWVICT